MPIRIPHRSLVLPLTLVASPNTTRDEGSPFDGAGTGQPRPCSTDHCLRVALGR
ncbi:MAG: hypothetical protein IPN32_29065 [Deltaproteobacteria bacterium]|nr:hypothetical protein [Deltaproteobacteria bacterium]